MQPDGPSAKGPADPNTDVLEDRCFHREDSMFLGEVICPPWSFSGDVAWALESGRRSLVPSINKSTIYHHCFLMICGAHRMP